MKEHAISWYVSFFFYECMGYWRDGNVFVSIFFNLYLLSFLNYFFCFCLSLSIIIALDKKKIKKK
jgi:hypothetical protein